MLRERTNQDILEELDKYVIGHQEAKKLLITLVNRSKMAHVQKYGYLNDSMSKMNCLLIGASGTGKTHLVNSLQKIVHFPLIKIDASQLNPAANQSYSVKDVKKSIVHNAERLVQDDSTPYNSLEGTVDQTIVFLDEMDKLCMPFGKNDGWNVRTQSELLTFIEDQDEFKNVSFIFAGAFTKLRQKQKSSSIGFNQEDVGELLQIGSITDKQLMDYGMSTELLGRISAITELDELTEETMSIILNTMLLPEKYKELEYFIQDVSKSFCQDLSSEFIKEALESGQGVRYLKRRLNKHFLDLEFDYEEKQHRTLTASTHSS